MKRLMFIILFAGLTVMCGCVGQPQEADAGPPVEAEDFLLKDPDGNETGPGQYKGKNVVMLVFSATWCPSCRAEIPELKRVNQKYKDKGLVILNIFIQESAEKVSPYAERNKIDYRILLDEEGSVARTYNVRGIPYVVIIDRAGIVQYRGFHPSSGFDAILDKLLSGGKSAGS